MAFALISLLYSRINMLFIKPEPREQDPEPLIHLADEETHQTRKCSPPPSFFHHENGRLLTPLIPSKIYREKAAQEHAENQISTSIKSKPELTPESPFSQGDIHDEPDCQNGPPNSVMPQETESPAFVERLKLLEERIAESERIGSIMSHDLKRTQFEMLELRKALQASNEIIKQLEQMLGNVVLTRQSTTPTSYAEEQIHHIANAPSQQVDDQAYQTPYRLIKDKGIRSSARPVLASVAGFPPPTPEEFQQRIWPIQEPIGNIEVFIPKPLPAEEILPSETKENPNRLVKDKGMTSGPRPVLASVSGFPPPTPEEFQQRIWPIQEPIGNIEVFIPKPLPAEEILPSETKENPHRLVKDNGVTSSPRPVLASVAGFPPPTPLEFQDKIWPTQEEFEHVHVFIPNNPPAEEIQPSVTKENPHRLVKDNGVTSSPRPVLASVAGFPPPTPLEFQDKIWPTQEEFEHVHVFIPNNPPAERFSLLSRRKIPIDCRRDSAFCHEGKSPSTGKGQRCDILPKTRPCISGRIPTADAAGVQDKIWPTQEEFEHVHVFIPNNPPAEEIQPSVTKENPHRLVKDNGVTSSPRPVLASVAGFPPPTPLEFQDKIWPTQEEFEHVHVFIPNNPPAEEIQPSVTKENPYRLVKDNGVKSSPRPVLASVAGFPPPTPLEFQDKIWPTETRFAENVKILTPTLENPIPFSLTLDESYVDENETQLTMTLKDPPKRQKRRWFFFF
ncbi:hypothetical protein GHT06_017605 [Daphnia sinensis]|uniref:Uncharacterized protein n=1 Tax=Daphnia sinensis TaxID=1820382 RepID=A0AAD5PTY1_9CRUS|nr:hypothetical protein GHT06_017605 [Daphnia sinensis]